MQNKIDDALLNLLWDKWKDCNRNLYLRYYTFWKLQVVAIGWIFLASKDGLSHSLWDLKSISIIFVLIVVFVAGLYIRSLMATDLKVRNVHNPEIVKALIQKKIIKNIDFEDLISFWSPDDFKHSLNNWHSTSTNDWNNLQQSKIKRGTTSTLKVVTSLSIINLLIGVIFTAYKIKINYW